MSDSVKVSSLKSPAVATGMGYERARHHDSVPPFGANTIEILTGQKPVTPVLTETMSEEDIKKAKERMPAAGERYIVGDDGIEYIIGRDGTRLWCARPLFDHQLNLGEIRTDPPKTEIFNLSDENDLKALNELEKLIIDDGPGIIFAEKDRQFFEGTFYLCLTYRRVWYKIPTK